MTAVDLIYCLFFLMVFIVIYSLFRHEKNAGISPSPTMPGARKIIINMIHGHMNSTQPNNIAEFGCGWGGLMRRLRRAFPVSKITGYEISPYPLIVSRLYALFHKRVRVLNNDFFDADWADYDVIVCYLSPAHMAKIESRINDLEKKPLLISCSFPLPNTLSTETRIHQSLVKVPIYAYK